jgi:hypothetical protein
VKRQKLKEFNTVIGEIGISFIFEQSFFENKIKRIKNEFISQNKAEVRLNIHFGNIPENGKRKKIFDTESNWCLFYREGKYVLQDRPFESSLPPGRLVILNPDFKSGDIYFINDEFHQNFRFDPLDYPLDQVLMIMLLSRNKGAMFHACGVDDSNCGYLFLGNSTHGKSTMARLWSENHSTVLNDDRIIVREKAGQLWMYGTPWHGEFKKVSPEGLPIRKIFFLRHGRKNSVVPKERAGGVSMLLTRCFPPLWDKQGMDYTLDLCHRLVNKIPCYELSFVPGRQVLNLVRDI